MTDDAPDDDGQSAETEPPRNRRKLYLLLTPVIVMSVLGYVGTAFYAPLIKRLPLLTIFFDPRNRTLALTAGRTALAAWAAVAIFRLLLLDPIYYLLGREYGDAGIRWLQRRIRGISEYVKLLETMVEKGGLIVVAVMPNAYICLLAGAGGMAPASFFAANIGGTIARLWLIRMFAGFFEKPLSGANNFLGKYQLPITVFTFAYVGWELYRSRKTGDSDLKSVGAVEAELDAAQAEVEAERLAEASGADDPRPADG